MNPTDPRALDLSYTLSIDDGDKAEHIVRNVLEMTIGDGNKALDLLLISAIHMVENSGMKDHDESVLLRTVSTGDHKFRVDILYITEEDRDSQTPTDVAKDANDSVH